MPKTNNDALQETPSEPVISDEELKMPDQAFGTNNANGPSLLGPILAVLIVVLILLLGGLYLWGTTLNIGEPEYVPVDERPTPEENNEPESTTAEADVQALETMSTSDEIEAIEADLESTDLDALEEELNQIDAELDAALTE